MICGIVAISKVFQFKFQFHLIICRYRGLGKERGKLDAVERMRGELKGVEWI
jgi:hypothetical protein